MSSCFYLYFINVNVNWAVGRTGQVSTHNPHVYSCHNICNVFVLSNSSSRDVLHYIVSLINKCQPTNVTAPQQLKKGSHFANLFLWFEEQRLTETRSNDPILIIPGVCNVGRAGYFYAILSKMNSYNEKNFRAQGSVPETVNLSCHTGPNINGYRQIVILHKN